jgi:hypothetical protein
MVIGVNNGLAAIEQPPANAVVRNARLDCWGGCGFVGAGLGNGQLDMVISY